MISAIVGGATVGYGGNTDWIVHGVMGEVETIRVRIKIVETILKRLLENTDLHDEWSLLEAALYKRARERNVAVHSEWAWSEDAPNAVLRIERDGTKSLWVERDFMDAFHRIKTLEHDLHAFLKKVCLAIEQGAVRV
ncbi:hypothetical protein [Sphingomonas sp. M1-B02]|uniref:hypothetical protein n=1 Tax=Sphingomonas sp. M1-B02 TaxID=3114300 RepID=UPI0022401644|nr:hypothetical protein [Sphingomonas sp. S6-11]UZK65860.1 hypothetical protein OKW87_15320 [Sphingomonas sp. S6-11]